jgi:exodeoxyribonuclease V alpha subunit
MPSLPERETDMASLSVTTPHQEFQPFIDAEVFTATEVHAAQRITNAVFSTTSTTNATFIDYLSVAIAVWAPVNGHVCIDLENVRQQVRDELGSAREEFDQKSHDALDWPSLDEWHQHLANNPLVFIPEPNNIDHVDHTKPLVLFGNMLYLTRQWADEGIVAIALRTRLTATPAPLSAQATTWVEAVFGKGSVDYKAQAEEEDSVDYQAQAVIKALTHNTTVLLGGPGTGKTYTIAGMLHAFYSEHAANSTGNTNPLRVAIAAPTAKAARQVTTSVGLSLALQHFPQTHADLISSVTKTSSTIHRLLGWSPGNRGRFAHHAQNFLPYDIVIIDEVSMVSLPLMARLLEALAPNTKLVLVGDPQQLKSVEAGAVLPDIASLHGGDTYPITKLLINRRQADEKDPNKVNDIGQLATKISKADLSQKDANEILKFIKGPTNEITFIALPDASADPSKSSQVLAQLDTHLQGYRDALKNAKLGNAPGALDALASVRVLCGHRKGPYGVAAWNSLVARTVGVSSDRGAVGQPLLNTRNDLRTGLVNGDTGIVVSKSNGRKVVFSTQDQDKEFEPSALEDIEVAFATTIHKSQGSEYETVIVVVPPVDSPLLRRELLYTAVTRARKHLVLIASEDAITSAVMSTINRASGLAARVRGISP